MILRIVQGEYLKSLDNIIQWQEMDVFNHESVSQHSYKVAIFCRVLMEDLFKNVRPSEEILAFKLAVVDAALLHDWDEIFIRRDISHETKYNSFNGSQIRDVLNEYVEHMVKNEFDSEEFFKADEAGKFLYNSICRPLPLVKQVVKIGDWLALMYYIRRELSLGNVSLNRNWKICVEGLVQAVIMLEDGLLKHSDWGKCKEFNFKILEDLKLWKECK